MGSVAGYIRKNGLENIKNNKKYIGQEYIFQNNVCLIKVIEGTPRLIRY